MKATTWPLGRHPYELKTVVMISFFRRMPPTLWAAGIYAAIIALAVMTYLKPA